MPSNLVEEILTAEDGERTAILASLKPHHRQGILQLLRAQVDNPWSRWEDDLVGYIEDGIGESLWSKQRDICQSVIDHQRTAVAACHAPGKSHLAGRIVAWWVSVHPPGTAMAVTIAPTHRQVRTILWPHIRKVAFQNNLPGEVLTQAWKMHGDVVAYGFSPSPYDESAAQGIHAPHLLIIVDEAGGIGEVVGQALEALMTGGHTRLLLLGNPPTDKEDSWFERACSSPLYNVIHLPATATPNFTGEEVGICRSCPTFVGEHSIATHLVDQKWVDDVISEFGPDSAFVEARVHARFPRMSKDKVIPLSWIEQALVDPDDKPEPSKTDVVRLGVDVAADGGDEMAVAMADGFTLTVRHRSSGAENNNAVDVAEMILPHILHAEQIHAERGITRKVRVKIDTIGVGWGVVGILTKWGKGQPGKPPRHRSVIVPVNVAKAAKDPGKFRNQRAEMWWTGRELFQPDADGDQTIKADIERKVLAQLSGPKYTSDGTGRISIETKAAMKRRGVASPDQAEACLLALYEPPGAPPDPISPVGLPQANRWGAV